MEKVLNDYYYLYIQEYRNCFNRFTYFESLCNTKDEINILNAYKHHFETKSVDIFKTHFKRLPINDIFKKIILLSDNCIEYIKIYMDMNDNSKLVHFNQYIFM